MSHSVTLRLLNCVAENIPGNKGRKNLPRGSNAARGQPVGQPYSRYFTLLHSTHTGSGVPSSGKKS